MKKRLCALSFAFIATIALPAAAQTYIGVVNPGAFNNTVNWDTGTLPAFDTTTAIVLNSPSGTGAFTINNDIVGVSTLNSLTLSSSGIGTNYRVVTLSPSVATNTLQFAGTNPSLVANLTGATGTVAHTITSSVSLTTNLSVTASNVAFGTAFTGNINISGGSTRTFNTNGNTVTLTGATGTTVTPGQTNLRLAQAVAGAAKFALVGGTSGTTAGVGGSNAALIVNASTSLASGASAEITMTGGTSLSGGGGGGGATLQYDATTNSFAPLVIFSNASGNATATKVIQLSGFNGTVTGLSSSGQSGSYVVRNQAAATSTLTINNSANYSFGGRLTNTTGTSTGILSIVKNGVGEQTLTGTGTASQLNYTGTTTVNAGTLTFATTVNNALTGAMTVNGGTLNVGSATGTTLTLSGGVTVNAGGTLNILPGVAISAVDVNGGTVSGTGTLPAFTLESGATLAPGVGGAGTINAAGLTFDGGSTITFELNQTTPALSDRVALTGAFTKGTAGLYTFNFGTTTLTGANTFDLLTFTSTDFVPGDFTLVGLSAANGFNYNVVVTGTAVQLVSSAVAVVPESGTGLLAGLGLLAGIALPVIRRRATR